MKRAATSWPLYRRSTRPCRGRLSARACRWPTAPLGVEPCVGPGDKSFDGYSDEGLAEWHERLKLAR